MEKFDQWQLSDSAEAPQEVKDALNLAQQDERAGSRLKLFACVGSQKDMGMSYWLVCKSTPISPEQSETKLVSVLLHVPEDDGLGKKPSIMSIQEIEPPRVAETWTE